MKYTLSIIITGLLGVGLASAALPVVSNVTSSQRSGTKLVDITYDVADADNDQLKIRIEISSDGGVNYSVPAFSLTGAVGDNITPGTGKTIVWDAENDWDGEYSDEMKVKVIASDAKGLPGLEWGNEVPPGGFLMGQDGGAEGGGPSRHVNIPWSCWLSKYEITNAQYAEYLSIALSAGEVYRFGTTEMRAVAGKYSGIPADALLIRLDNDYDIRWSVNKLSPVTGRENRPVSVTWYGALAFGLHYGYDLPTTAEWEKAARGPDHDDEDEHRIYPWGDTLGGGYANYTLTTSGSGNGDPYDISRYSEHYSEKTPVGYFDGNQTPFGPDTANGYNLYDVVGNVAEWTRTSPTTIETYPQEESLIYLANVYGNGDTDRICRGGYEGSGYDSSIVELQLYYQKSVDKDSFSTPSSHMQETGFRVIRRSN